MKTIVFINGANVGSTGRIVYSVSALAETKGFKTFRAYPKSRNLLPPKENDIIISSVPEKFLSTRTAYLTGLNGCVAWIPTLRLLKKLDRLKPDILHLHNLHDSYINLPMLFSWIKKHDIKVVWTLHDCWSFTGHCPHFLLSKCSRWKTGCGHCPQLGIYPPLRVDTTAWLWKKKKQWFTGVKDLTIVTPSKWLADLVKRSYLKEYPVEVIYNGVDLKTFKPVTSDFRKEHGFTDPSVPSSQGTEYLVLGVSFDWGKRKGLDVFTYLARHLDSKYRIVLVGTNDALDADLPDNILSIHRTHDTKELAAIYSAADVLVNPTREEVLGMVNLEALACGTPVITFDTGGSPETIDPTCGKVVPVDDNETLLKEIVRVCETRPYSPEACIKRAAGFEKDSKFAEYLQFYGHP